MLSFYEDFYNIAYILKKLDLAAIPGFDTEAKESWGFINFRETSLLYDEAVSSQSDREMVLKEISHQLAHQWFGNLVTMSWWTDLWLNDGNMIIQLFSSIAINLLVIFRFCQLCPIPWNGCL